MTGTAPPDSDNVLLTDWTGPFGGVPAFDRMELDALKPALESGMANQLAEIEAIASNPEPPTFDNTIVALERSGRALSRVSAYYEVWSSNVSTPAFREVQGDMAPRLAEFESTITQNSALFARIQAVYDTGRDLGSDRTAPARLHPDQQRLVQVIYDRFARHGVTLEPDAKRRYAAIEQRLAALHTRFSNNVLADEEGPATYLDSDQIGGLPEAFVQAAALAATSRGRDGTYTITNTRSSADPFLTFSDDRSLREQVWRTYYSRGDNGDEHDNNAILAEIVGLRHERVRLLGYDDYATWRLENRMAKTPGQALDLMDAVWPAALARVEAEVADMQAAADAEDSGITIAPWDYRYYAEKVRQATYDLDSDEVKQYLQLDGRRLDEVGVVCMSIRAHARYSVVANPWADVLTADAAEAFAEAPGGFYDTGLAKKLVDNLLAVRNAVDPAEAYRAFRGRDATIDALMRDRGFPVRCRGRRPVQP